MKKQVKKTKKAQNGSPLFIGTANKGFDYNPAWNGQWFNGGSLPGATGNMYAREGAPSNGKYAKKTLPSAQNGKEMQYYQQGFDFLPKSISANGSVIQDNNGQWAHPGAITEIGSNQITMQNVPYPVMGISNRGDVKVMFPEQDYNYKGDVVREFPLTNQDRGQKKKLDDLTNFTNYNKPMGKKNTKKAQRGGRIDTNPVHLPDFQQQSSNVAHSPMTNKFNNFGQYIGVATDLIGGFQALGEEKEQVRKAQQDFEVSDVARKANATRPEQSSRRYVRPEDASISPNQMYVSYGTGTNILAKNGTKLQNGGGLNNLVALNDSAQVKKPSKKINFDKYKHGKATVNVTYTPNIGELQPLNYRVEYTDPQTNQPTHRYFPSEKEGSEFQRSLSGYRRGYYELANGGEIQNTFSNPYTIYTDEGYEPLNDSSQVKQFQFGGGVMDFLKSDEGSQAFSQVENITKNAFNNNAGYQIGSSIGKAASFIPGVGPILGKGLSMIGGAIGGALDPNDKKMKKYQDATQNNNMAMMLQNNIGDATYQNSSFMKFGGNLTNPQVIAKFDGMDVSEFKHMNDDMNVLRTGGNIRQNTLSELDSYNMGGDLQTHWGGYAEHLSHNPFLPEEGQTVMFRGNSHDESDGKGNTGIGVSYGKAEFGSKKADVEVQRNEPATKLYDPATGESSLNVFGALNISKEGASYIGDNKAKGRKVQSYIKEISEKENKANKAISKNSNELSALEPSTPFDFAKLNSFKMNMLGNTLKLKDYADIKQKTADYQNTINDMAQLHNLDAEALSKNKLQQAAKGAIIPKAQTGANQKPSSTSAMKDVPKGQHRNKDFYGKVTNAEFEQLKKNNPWYDWNNFNPNKKKDVLDFQKRFNDLSRLVGSASHLQEDDLLGEQTASARVDYSNIPTTTTSTLPVEQSRPQDRAAVEQLQRIPEQPNRFNPNPYLSQLSQYMRKPYQAGYDSYIPEWYAMSTNKLEPVQAQLYHPLLDTPYDISLQDRLNANQSTFNSLQNIVGNNPEALSTLAGQKYAADSGVLAEQMRLNQANKMGVFDRNRATLNDAQLKNLGVLDQQYVRQEQAKSNTKATTLEALKSIDDKMKQRDLENRTFAVYSNMFPQYGFDASGRAYNQGLTFFNTPTVYTEQATPIPSTATPPYVSTPRTSGRSEKGKNGLIVKSSKTLKNI